MLKGFMLSSEASLSAFVNECRFVARVSFAPPRETALLTLWRAPACSVLLSVRHPILVPLSGILLDGTSAYLRVSPTAPHEVSVGR